MVWTLQFKDVLKKGEKIYYDLMDLTYYSL